jgi:hypothetical protein
VRELIAKKILPKTRDASASIGIDILAEMGKNGQPLGTVFTQPTYRNVDLNGRQPRILIGSGLRSRDGDLG